MKDMSKYALSFNYRFNHEILSYEEYKEFLTHSSFEYIKYLCLKEMYARSQPSVDYDDLLKEHFKRIQNNQPAEDFYKRYYLSREETKYIVDKYLDAFNLRNQWHNNVDVLLEDAQRVYVKDKWIPEHTDELGEHPGYRGYEDAMPLRLQVEQILHPSFQIPEAQKKEIEDLQHNYMYNENITKTANSVEISEEAENVTKLFIDFLKERKNFYQFDKAEGMFSAQIYLGHSPYSNEKAVQEYWKEKGVELEIDPRHLTSDEFWIEENEFEEE